MRYDPFRELDQVARQLFRQAGVGAPMDAYRHGDEFVVQFDLPGVDPASIDVTVEADVLTVAATRAGGFGDDDQVLVSERPRGEIRRQVVLGEQLDADRISADYDRGVLTLTLPVAEQAKPRKVEIGQGTRQRELVGASA